MFVIDQGGSIMNSWYDISGYEGMYQINEDKIVRSLDRVINGRKVLGKTLNGPNLSKDVHAIRLSKNGDRKTFSLNELFSLRVLPKSKRHVKVRCIDEDKIFDSETAAATYYGMHVSSVSDCIHDGKYHCGHCFERV